jgi:hypothetical protein
MTTPNSPTPPSLPLFRGPYYNRRRLLSQAKPKIRKLKGVDVWVCAHQDDKSPVWALGKTPTIAYNVWKRNESL